MSTMSHGSSPVAQQRRPSWVVPEMWASLAITAMWVAVFVTALWGPDAKFQSVDGSSSTIPSAIFVAVFACLGTWIVARYGFRRQED